MEAHQLAWTNDHDTDIDEIVKQILSLEVDFRDVKPSKPKVRRSYYVEGGLLARLHALKLISWTDIPHEDPNMPPSCVFRLQLPNGTPVALTDVKRQGRAEGLTYAFLLAPVFDNLDLYNRETDEVEVPASHKWVHPVDHMMKVAMTHDSRILNKNGLSGYFPLSIQDWVQEYRSVKVSMLYKFILNYCEQYGDPAPAFMKNGIVELTNTSVGIIKRSAVVDFGRDMTDDEMLPVALDAQSKINICIVGSKSTSRRIRKYMLANEYGGTILDRDGLTSLHRGAAGRSQLLRALQTCKMTVAIVQCDTMSQVHITPSGIRKQDTDMAFLPQVFNTHAEYEEYLKHMNKTAEEIPAEMVPYVSWQGEKRQCWTIGARSCIRIGKMVDVYGNKFMPRYHPQVHTIIGQETVPIDLIIPVSELIDKDIHHEFFKNSVERRMYLDNGMIVHCQVAERTLYRTGSASENIPPRWRMCNFKGIDSFPIWWQLNQIQPQEERSCDTTYAKALLALKKQIALLTGTQLATSDEFSSSSGYEDMWDSYDEY